MTSTATKEGGLKQIPLPVAIAAVMVLVALAAFVIWRNLPQPAPRVTAPPSGPIPLPPSQQGTRLGNRVLGTQMGAPPAPQQTPHP